MDILIKFNAEDITYVQLAEYMGYSQYEIDQMHIMWPSVYSNEWIYLCDDLILNVIGHNDVDEYIKSSLVKCVDYTADIDYRVTDIHNKSVARYYKLHPQLNNVNKKYYIITCDTYLDILTGADTSISKSTRSLYRKFVKVADVMKRYQLDRTIYHTQRQIDDMRIICDHVKPRINDVEKVAKTSIFYIVTSVRYAGQSIFKPGYINSCNKRSIDDRLNKYNISKVGNDLFYYCRKTHTYNAYELVNKVKAMMNHVGYTIKKDMVVIKYKALIDIVDFISDQHMRYYEHLNEFLDSDEYKDVDTGIQLIPSDIYTNINTNAVCVYDDNKCADTTKRIKMCIENMDVVCRTKIMKDAIVIYRESCEPGGKLILVWKDYVSLLRKSWIIKCVTPIKITLKDIIKSSDDNIVVRWRT